MPASILSRYAVYLALAAGLLFGGLSYRSHVFDSGLQAGLDAASAAATEARLLSSRADALAAERASARVASDLQSLKANHDRVTDSLKTALAASDLRAARLSARIAGLLDEAAGVRPGPPADSSGTGKASDTPQADSSVALLIETVNENYAICREDQARLAGLQTWYRDLAEGRQRSTAAK